MPTFVVESGGDTLTFELVNFEVELVLGEQGPKGDQGDQGDPGPQGPPGDGSTIGSIDLGTFA